MTINIPLYSNECKGLHEATIPVSQSRSVIPKLFLIHCGFLAIFVMIGGFYKKQKLKDHNNSDNTKKEQKYMIKFIKVYLLCRNQFVYFAMGFRKETFIQTTIEKQPLKKFKKNNLFTETKISYR